MKRATSRGWSPLLAVVAVVACSSTPDENVGRTTAKFSVGGCYCPQSGSCGDLSYSDIPGDGNFFITTFGGGSDTGGMSCGGTADGTWPYVADLARFGCGAKVQVSANGKSCVALVADCGPNRCVEEAASYSGCSGHHPILDASPFITEYLFGIGGSGWSDGRVVNVQQVDGSTPIGCPGSGVDDGHNCSGGQEAACGNYGCSCGDGQCSGGWSCDGNGCSAKHTNDCAQFGCGCEDGTCSGGYCDGSGCNAKMARDCAAYGCGCADGHCSGGFCDGTGCTAKETNDCAHYGCGCVDGKCSGGYCDGSGCTAKQETDCPKYGCGCADGKCAGGFCPGSGCTEKETNDCAQYGCGCSMGKCKGGACP